MATAAAAPARRRRRERNGAGGGCVRGGGGVGRDVPPGGRKGRGSRSPLRGAGLRAARRSRCNSRRRAGLAPGSRRKVPASGRAVRSSGAVGAPAARAAPCVRPAPPHSCTAIGAWRACAARMEGLGCWYCRGVTWRGVVCAHAHAVPRGRAGAGRNRVPAASGGGGLAPSAQGNEQGQRAGEGARSGPALCAAHARLRRSRFNTAPEASLKGEPPQHAAPRERAPTSSSWRAPWALAQAGEEAPRFLPAKELGPAAAGRAAAGGPPARPAVHRKGLLTPRPPARPRSARTAARPAAMWGSSGATSKMSAGAPCPREEMTWGRGRGRGPPPPRARGRDEICQRRRGGAEARP
jgi:hypothetical protein